MHQNQSKMYSNNLNSHASLLLSASPTIITSPLQNNSNNNPQSSSPTQTSIAPPRKQSATPLLVAANLDNDGQADNPNNLSNFSLAEGYINFKKPQNEMFKKLDGKIQRIVAAHSNLNKLYALNDFSSLGVGPKRPSELPPQLPPPPPWVPKVASDYGNNWTDEGVNPLAALQETSAQNLKLLEPDPDQEVHDNPNIGMRTQINRDSTTFSPQANKTASISIDSAITKLHQRRQQQHQQVAKKTTHNLANLQTRGSAPSPSTSNQSKLPTISPAQFNFLAQKIKETLETECTTKDQTGILSSEEKKKFQEDLIALLKQEIAAVTKSAKLKFCSPPQNINKPKASEHRSLLLKSSPQSLFNTIRRETSLLLNKRDSPQSSNSSTTTRVANLPHFKGFMVNRHARDIARRQATKIHHTIKVVVPPSDYQQSNKLENSDNDTEKDTTRTSLSYQVIRNKIHLFQEINQIYLGKSTKYPRGTLHGMRYKKASIKSLDNIVDRLQAKCGTPDSVGPQMHDKHNATSLLEHEPQPYSNPHQLHRLIPTVSEATAIPVFRSPSLANSKSSYLYTNSSGASKIVNMRSKKTKRSQRPGLRLGNYLERECPQPTLENLTIEQFAEGFDLFRRDDYSKMIAMKEHRKELLRSETKWRMPVGNRPLRLRRLRGERTHMPASASYKATREVGLQ